MNKTGLILLWATLACAPKQHSNSITVVSTVPYARHVAVDVLQEGQLYEKFFWKEYTIDAEKYTFLYRPLGKSGDFSDDILIMQYGSMPHVQFLDQSVVGGLSYIMSIDGTQAAPYSAFPADVQQEMQFMYLDSLVRINATFTPQEIKALEAIKAP